jgi:hypothetical protein
MSKEEDNPYEELRKNLIKNSKYKLLLENDTEVEKVKETKHNTPTEDKNYYKKYSEIRNSYSYIKADKEAEDYISNLRDIGEYNRWSLKLAQKWTSSFLNGN